MLTTALLLAGFAIAGTGLVAFTYENTKDQIAWAEREALLKNLHSVVESVNYDNELISDTIEIQSEKYLGTPKALPVFRARKNGEPAAAILTTIAPDGYNGDIKLLIGIRYNGTLSGVRVLTHRETPGLGDAIEARKSDWAFTFNEKSLTVPQKKKWKVKRDGGDFDQLTGATITPRAIVKAVRKALEYFELNRDELFRQNNLDYNPSE